MVYAEGGDRIPRSDVRTSDFLSGLGSFRGGAMPNYKPEMDRMQRERRLAEQGNFVDPRMDFNRMNHGSYANRYSVPQDIRSQAVNYYDNRLKEMQKQAYIQSLLRR